MISIVSRGKRRGRSSDGIPREATLPASSSAVIASGTPRVVSQGRAISATRAPRSGGPHAKLGSASLPALTVAREAPVTRNATSPLPPDATYLVAPRSSTLGGVRSTVTG